eukprot:jgi/Botrbrau1/21048/Bobra.0144s0049.4
MDSRSSNDSSDEAREMIATLHRQLQDERNRSEALAGQAQADSRQMYARLEEANATLEAAAAEISKMRHTETDLRSQVAILSSASPSSRTAEDLVTPSNTDQIQEKNVGQLESEREANKEAIGAMESAHKVQVERLEDEATVRRSQLQKMHTEANKQKMEIENLHYEATARKHQIQHLQSEATVRRDEINALHTEMQTKSTDFTRLQAEANSQREQITKLATDMGRTNAHVSMLETEASVRQAKIKTMEDDMGNRMALAAQLEAELEQTKMKMKALQDSTVSKVDIMQQLESEVGTKKAEISRLEAVVGVKNMQVGQMEAVLRCHMAERALHQENVVEATQALRERELQYTELENYARTLRSRLQELELHNEALEEQTYAATVRAQKAEARVTRHRGEAGRSRSLAMAKEAIVGALLEAHDLGEAEFKKCVRDLQLRWHPDKNPIAAELATEITMTINAAVAEVEARRKRSGAGERHSSQSGSSPSPSRTSSSRPTAPHTPSATHSKPRSPCVDPDVSRPGSSNTQDSQGLY